MASKWRRLRRGSKSPHCSLSRWSLLGTQIRTQQNTNCVECKGPRCFPFPFKNRGFSIPRASLGQVTVATEWEFLFAKERRVSPPSVSLRVFAQPARLALGSGNISIGTRRAHRNWRGSYVNVRAKSAADVGSVGLGGGLHNVHLPCVQNEQT